MKWNCIDFKCVLKPTKSRLSLTHHANKSSHKNVKWSEINYLHVASYTRALACMGKRGHLPPPWKCCNVFLYSIRYSKTFGRIIYTLFSQPVVGLACGSSPSNPHRRSIPGSCWGNFVPRVPRPLICPPLEKILLAPITVQQLIWLYYTAL